MALLLRRGWPQSRENVPRGTSIRHFAGFPFWERFPVSSRMSELRTQVDVKPGPPTGLHHHLSAGQMTMVAVGGSIGTGLLLGSGAAIEIAGASVILSFLVAAFIAWTIAVAIGEL